MASYLRELERDGILPAIRSGLTHDERLTRSPSTGYYGHRAESPCFQPRPPSAGNENKRQMQEIQDQMKAFKEELQKKDTLIQKLVSMESVPKAAVKSQADSMRLENLYCGDRQALDAARSELAAVQVKAEKQQNKIKELENEINIRDVRIKELHFQMDTSRENETRLQSMVESLRSQLTDLKGRAGAFESVAGRSEYTVVALQKENKAAQERIVDLETRQRKQLEEREEAQARVESLDRKLKDVLSQFASILKVEPIRGGNPAVEEICRKLTDQMEENAVLRGKMLTLTETVKNSELETKASRETIMRLVSEMGKEQKEQSKFTSEQDRLRSRSRERYRYHDDTNYEVEKSSYLRSCLKSPTQHRDGSHSRERDIERCTRKELEREIDMLKERLDASQRTINAQCADLNLRDSRLSFLERELPSSSSVRGSSPQFILFREHLANILADIDGSCQSGEDFIKHKVESLVFSCRDLKNTTRTLEKRVKELTDQLESQYELHKTAAARARKAESEASELHKRLLSAEGVLATGDVSRGSFRYDKEQYMRCLQQLGEAMKMDRISLDIGMDMAFDALIARAQQLVNMEKGSLDDKSTHIYNLQRKVKSLKEQLESKDLHIDLLRKKITSLEDKILGKTTLEMESDNETLRMRQIEKLADTYKIQLADAQQEIINLKAQLLGSSELRMRTLEQRKETEELVHQVEELEKLRRKQAHKIRDLKTEIDSSNQTNQDNRAVNDNAVQALNSELRTTKTALSTIQGREKQLIDFRNVVARMLGLNISTLAVPDYEIISRLEKLIQAHHGHAFATLSLDEDLANIEDGFFRGYEDYRNTVGASESQNMHNPRERVKRTTFKARARSCSPKRRIYPKVY